MGNQIRSFGAVAALGFAVLFFGASHAQAQDRFSGSQRFSGHGHFDRRGDHEFSHHSFSQFPVRHRGFGRPFYPRASRFFAGPRYRLERVFLYVPFPHWGFQRVYFSGPGYGYGAYCDPY